MVRFEWFSLGDTGGGPGLEGVEAVYCGTSEYSMAVELVSSSTSPNTGGFVVSM